MTAFNCAGGVGKGAEGAGPFAGGGAGEGACHVHGRGAGALAAAVPAALREGALLRDLLPGCLPPLPGAPHARAARRLCRSVFLGGVINLYYDI